MQPNPHISISLQSPPYIKKNLPSQSSISNHNSLNSISKRSQEAKVTKIPSHHQMASSMKSCLLLSLAFSISIHAAFADVICENLPENLCAFAVATSGKRCALESYKDEGAGGVVEYTCMASEVVVAERLAGRIESDQCVAACGVDRSSVGISSDAFMAPEFISSLCSPSCYQNCPNIVDLYFNLAAGEGVFLPALCEKQRSNPHRAMLELLSSGGAAPSTVDDSFAPAPAPALSSYYY